VGGADTYQRLNSSIHKERLDELTERSRKARRDFRSETSLSMAQKDQTVNCINEKCHKVLASGGQKISRCVTHTEMMDPHHLAMTPLVHSTGSPWIF